MTDVYKNWSFEDFLIFIMHYAAMADYNLAPEEQEIIKEISNKDKYHEIMVFFAKNTDYDNVQAILYFKDKYCTDPEHIDKVFQAVETIFNADGYYNFYERNMKQALTMLLKNS